MPVFLPEEMTQTSIDILSRTLTRITRTKHQREAKLERRVPDSTLHRLERFFGKTCLNGLSDKGTDKLTGRGAPRTEASKRAFL